MTPTLHHIRSSWPLSIHLHPIHTRSAHVLCVCIGCVWIMGCMDDPVAPALPGSEAVFTVAQLTDGEMVEVMACKLSHEHELRFVRTVADAASAEIYRRCVPPSAACTEARFPVDSLFVKLEYDSPTGCEPSALAAYTAVKKLQDGALPEGFNWRWQRVSPALDVEQDGAPDVCLRCHTDHCLAPRGFDLRCVPD
jgi:hypothetical protein